MKAPWFWLLGGCLMMDGFLGFYFWRQYKERDHDEVILAAAQRYGIDAALVKAVVWRESGFDARAKGRAGEIGLMQITEPAALEWAEAEKLQRFSHRQLYDPAKNTLAGSWYLRKCLSRYQRTDNPAAYALADYNAGRANVLRWNKGHGLTNSSVFLRQIDFPATQNYVQTVLDRYHYYKPAFKTAAAVPRRP
jgi:soluble lytic murein transglycosylase